jgi:hypothetical protein
MRGGRREVMPKKQEQPGRSFVRVKGCVESYPPCCESPAADDTGLLALGWREVALPVLSCSHASYRLDAGSCWMVEGRSRHLASGFISHMAREVCERWNGWARVWA